MCASAPLTSFLTTSAVFVNVVSCTLTVPVNGTAFLTASASLFISPNLQSAELDVRLATDGAPDNGSLRSLAVVADDGDGSDLSMGTQGLGSLSPGTHTFTLQMERSSGSGSPELLHPVVQALFIPSGSTDTDIRACSSQFLGTMSLSNPSLVSLLTCAFDAPSAGSVYVRASAGVVKTINTDVSSFDSVLEIDGLPAAVSGGDPASNTVTIRDSRDPFRKLAFTTQRAASINSGHHTFTLAVKTVAGEGINLVNSSVRAFFVPNVSEESTACASSSVSSTTPTGSAPTVIVSCSINLPRDGAIQVHVSGDVLPSTANYTGQYDIVFDGLVQPSTTRYMNMYSIAADQTVTPMVSDLQHDATAGQHTIQFEMRRYGLGGSPTMGTAWISAIATFPAPGVTPPPTTPTSPPVTSTPDNSTPDTPPPNTPAGQGEDYVPLVPVRVLDTRGPAPIGYIGNKPAAGQTVQVQVTGGNVPADAKAVVLNLTGSEAAGDGYVTAWPCGSPQPTASNLNVTVGSNVPNLVIAKVGDGGRVCLFTQPSQHLIADISGYMPAASSYVPVVPDRVLDTRADTQVGYTGGKPGPGQIIELTVEGVGTSNLPADATAVVLNVTGTAAGADGYITVWPCGSAQPTASNLNLVVGIDRPNLIVSKIGPNGRVCLFTQNGAHLVADINGYMPAGSSYVPLVPGRILDTRAPNQIGYTGDKPGVGEVVQLHVVDVDAAPVPADATAIVLNITGTDATADGYITVWPCGALQPTASNLNLTAGSTAPNLVMSKIGDNGDVCIFTQSGAHLVADVAGYWRPPR
jgi:hypothetical protein